MIATAAPANVASYRVLLKAGMQLGTLRPNDDGSLTQLFAWRSLHPAELKLEEIYVAQALRGKGMGRTLLALADLRPAPEPSRS